MAHPPLISWEDFHRIVQGKNLVEPEKDALKLIAGLPHANGTIVDNRAALAKHLRNALLKLSGLQAY